MTGTRATSKSKRKSVKRRKVTGKLPSVEGKRKSVQKETLADSVTMTANVEQVHVLPLPLQSRRRTTVGKTFGKARFLQGAVPPGKGSRNRARITVKELAQTQHGIWQHVCTTFMETWIKTEPRSSRLWRIFLTPSTIILEQSGFPGPRCTC